MTTLRILLLTPVAFAVAGCTTPTSKPATGRCDAAAASGYVGGLPDAATVQAAQRAAQADTVRTIRHDQMVTMEYLEGRLNLYLDTGGRIGRITCG